MSEFRTGVTEWVRARWPVLAYFLAATGLLAYQHSLGWSWDFVVYSLNGQYLFHEGVYMEWLRPPLVPTVLGLLGFVLPVRLAEYVFVGLSSVAFLYGCHRLSRAYDLPLAPLYVFALSPFVIFYATLNGTELLYLSFLSLFLAEFRSSRAGLWLGLAVLTRYSGAVLVPLVFFQREGKVPLLDWTVLKTLVVAFAVGVPWLLFNFIALGHPLASFADFYALNVVERGTSTPFDPLDLLAMSGISLIVAAPYLADRIGIDPGRIVGSGATDAPDDGTATEDRVDPSGDVLVAALGALVVLRQFDVHLAERRFLIEFALVAAFFAAKGWRRLEFSRPSFRVGAIGRRLRLGASERAVLLAAIAIVYLLAGGYLVGGTDLADPGPYEAASDEVGDCVTVSDQWVYLAYAGTPAGPGDFRTEAEFLEDGYRVATFEGDGYTVQGDGCRPGPYDTTHVERLERLYGETQYCSYLPIDTCGLESSLSRIA